MRRSSDFRTHPASDAENKDVTFFLSIGVELD